MSRYNRSAISAVMSDEINLLTRRLQELVHERNHLTNRLDVISMQSSAVIEKERIENDRLRNRIDSLKRENLSRYNNEKDWKSRRDYYKNKYEELRGEYDDLEEKSRHFQITNTYYKTKLEVDRTNVSAETVKLNKELKEWKEKAIFTDGINKKQKLEIDDLKKQNKAIVNQLRKRFALLSKKTEYLGKYKELSKKYVDMTDKYGNLKAKTSKLIKKLNKKNERLAYYKEAYDKCSAFIKEYGSKAMNFCKFFKNTSIEHKNVKQQTLDNMNSVESTESH